MNFKPLILACLCLFSLSQSFCQESGLKKVELENFILITDQNAYLSGDRVWFAAKLLKNHESYRYSKLAYIVVLDASGKPIHQEKMLLTGQDMVYGDMFIPENSPSGVFSIVVYSKWMANFEDFPIAKREFLVVNPTVPKPAGEPAFFWEQIPFANAPVSVFHTSGHAEIIEIQDKSGKTLEVLEGVAPMKKTLSSVKPAGGYQVVFRNKTFQMEPEKWHWDPSDFSLEYKGAGSAGDFKILTHADWMMVEEISAEEKSILNKNLYQKLGSFKISVLNRSDQLVWTYQVQLPSKNSGQMQVSSRGKTGEEMSLGLVSFSDPIRGGIVLASQVEDSRIVDMVEILNHPNWKNLSAESAEANLPQALGKIVETPQLMKDFSPMFDYKYWSIPIETRFRSTVRPANFSFSLPEEILEPMVRRKVYQEHFEIAEEVVDLQSPFTADKVYYLEDYAEFRDVESLIKEIVPQVRLKKSASGGSKELFVANTDNQQVKFNKKPLILIDFYRSASLEEVWKLDLLTLDRIELYYHRSTVQSTNLGEAVGDGLLVFFTKNNEYFIKNNLPKERYFLYDVSVPRRPDYSQRKHNVLSGNPLQFWDTGFTFYRGKSKSQSLKFDTAGEWHLEAWLFGNAEFEKVQKKIQIDP